MKIVLSIQGGGIRGIIPCLALCELERQTGKLTRDMADFVGGTSTGALLTACVAAGIPAAAALKVYTEQGPRIFSPTNDAARKINLIINGHQFYNRTLYQVVANTLGDQAKMLVNDSPVPLLITTGNMLGDPWYFTQDRPQNAGAAGKAPLVDAAVASACATTYHAPWMVPGFGYHSDGGCVGLADPVFQVCCEAFAGYRCYGTIDPGDAKVISLGTGCYKPDTMPDPPHSLLDGISWVTSALVGSAKGFAAEAVERTWKGILTIFNPQLPREIDEADTGAIPTLVSIGTQMAAEIDWLKILGLSIPAGAL